MRAIRTVIDVLSGERISCETLLDRDDNLAFVRKAIAESKQLGHARYVCDRCKGRLGVNDGGPNRESYFQHRDNRIDCDWYRDECVTYRYQIYKGQPESESHKKTRSSVYSALKCDDRFTGIEVEKWVFDEEGRRRKPDIACVFRGKKLHIEVQVSPISLDDVLARQVFSKQQGIYLLWVMDEFGKLDQHSSLRELATVNLFNALVFDDEAALISQKKGRVNIKSMFPNFDALGLPEKWICKIIDFAELTFDSFYALAYLHSGYRCSASAVLRSECRTISHFRKLISECHRNSDEKEMGDVFLKLARTARLSSVRDEFDGHSYRMLLIACECIRKRRYQAASYSFASQDVFWAIDVSLNAHPNFARSLASIIDVYWPELWNAEQSKKPIRKLRELAAGSANREINRVLRFLYPKAAHFLPLA